MIKLQTCDVYLPALGISVGFQLHKGRWTLVGSIESTKSPRKPRGAEPIAAFARQRTRTLGTARRVLH